MRKFLFCLLLCSLALQTGCSHGFSQHLAERLPEAQAPTMTPEEKLPTISEGPSIAMVADFEEEGEKIMNNLGGESGDWNMNLADINNSYTDLKVVPMAGKDGKTTRVLSLAYSVDSDLPAQNGFWTKLMGFDASSYDHLEFEIKGDAQAGFTERFRLEVKKCLDPQCVEKVSGSATVPVTGEWRTVSIPLNAMTGLIDFSNPEAWETPRVSYKPLDEFVIIFNNGFVTKKQGKIYFDNIRFVRTGEPGPSAVDFPPRKIEKTPLRLEPLEFERFLVGRLRGFPKTLSVKKDFPKDDRAFLKEVAKDTWEFFDKIVDSEHDLPLDTVIFGEKEPLEATTWVGDYTSVTNVGVYLMAVVSAYDLGFITREDAVNRIQKTLTTTEKLEYHTSGFLYNYYDTTTLERTSYFVSFVDSGWLMLGLYVAKNAFPEELTAQTTHLLERGNFKFFYDPLAKQMFHGFYDNLNVYSDYHYGVFYTEPRAASYISVARGDVPEAHWFEGMARTFPTSYQWQSQPPKDRVETTLEGYKYVGGHYEWEGLKYVPSWGGSAFEALMPAVVLKEKELAPEGLGKNNATHVQGQIRYALEEKMPVWGMSPCSVPEGGYSEYGAKPMGVKGYKSGVVTPHASALALDYAPGQVVANLRKLIELYDIYGEYGFYDAVTIATGKIARKYLALDQGMILLAINNYLNRGALRERFHADPEMKKYEKLLSAEKFFEAASQEASASAKP
ncbi:MAG: glucoamylase family protein [Candidatus Omnitrophota bacterium]